MKNYINFFAVISCFVLSITSAHASDENCSSLTHKESNASPQGAMFEDVDTNGDGSISKAEFDAYYSKQNAKHLREMNANKDGRIAPDEMQGLLKRDTRQNNGTANLDQRFSAADTNHDGVLDREEANAMPMLKYYFDKVDANKDGKVTRQEYLDAMPLLHRAIGIDSSGKGQVL